MTKDERKEYDKKYREANKDKIKKYREANKDKKKEYNKRFREKNKDYDKTYKKEYIKNNKDKIAEQNKKSRSKNKDKIKEYKAKYYIDNKDKILTDVTTYYKKRRSIDPVFKTKTNYINLLNLVLKKKGYTKQSRAHEILGCSYEEFHTYLESKFESWMTWENRGKYKKNEYNVGWDIDHIIPSSSATNEEELIKLFHYTNLRPLCSKVNRDEKKAKVIK